jgi:hypothetical protein
MAFPASRFVPAASPLPLRGVAPADHGDQHAGAWAARPVTGGPAGCRRPGPSGGAAAGAGRPGGAAHRGTCSSAGSRSGSARPLADRKVTLWEDETSPHALLGGTRIKTLPSRLGVAELARPAVGGARPAGPSPLLAGTGTVVEVERTVNAAGLAGLAGAQVNVGYQLAGQRVILRMDGTQMMVITSDGELARTMPCPVPAGDRYRLRGARKAAASPAPPSGPVTVQLRVSCRGGIMVASQKIQVGLIHAPVSELRI